MAVGDSLRWIAIDFLCMVIWTAAVGISAPRWPSSWLQSDPIPLRLQGFESVRMHRRLGTTWFTRHLPELGSLFGGQSKSALPGSSIADLQAYLIEVRRAEWVHWLSMISWIPLLFFGPRWVMALMAFVAVAANTPFLLILRHNRLRLLSALERSAAIAAGNA